MDNKETILHELNGFSFFGTVLYLFGNIGVLFACLQSFTSWIVYNESRFAVMTISVSDASSGGRRRLLPAVVEPRRDNLLVVLRVDGTVDLGVRRVRVFDATPDADVDVDDDDDDDDEDELLEFDESELDDDDTDAWLPGLSPSPSPSPSASTLSSSPLWSSLPLCLSFRPLLWSVFSLSVRLS